MEAVHKSSDKPHFLREIWDYRYALHNLVLKDFRVRYRNMSLGVLWSVLNPLVFLGVLLTVFSFIHKNPHQHFFPIFLLLGLINFSFFSMCIGGCASCILENISLVETLVGSSVWMIKDELPELEDEQFFWSDLEGVAVFDERLGELGQIVGMFNTPAHDVLEVSGPRGEVLIPAVEPFLLGLDEEGCLIVNLPDGLVTEADEEK